MRPDRNPGSRHPARSGCRTGAIVPARSAVVAGAAEQVGHRHRSAASPSTRTTTSGCSIARRRFPTAKRPRRSTPPQAECCIPAPSVLEFAPTESSSRRGAARAQGYEWFKTEHGIFVDTKDNVWLSGSAKEDNQILKFTNKGKFLMQIGHAGKNTGSNDTENLGGPGRPVRVSARRTSCSSPTATSTTASSCSTPTRARTSGTGARTARRPTTTTSSRRARSWCRATPPPQFNNPVHAVVVSNDELVYVADRTNNRLQVFRLDGTFVKEVVHRAGTRCRPKARCTTSRCRRTRSSSSSTCVDGSNKAVRVLDRQTLEIVVEHRRARRTQRARVLPRAQRRRRFEGQSLHRRGQQRPALLQVRVQGNGKMTTTYNAEHAEHAET